MKIRGIGRFPRIQARTSSLRSLFPHGNLLMLQLRIRRPSAPLFLLFAGCAWIAPVALEAQEGVIRGRVVDAESGQGVGEALVEALGASAEPTLTSENGGFRIEIQAGSYSLYVTRIGYQPTLLEDVEATAGQETVVEIEFPSQALALNPIIVTASRREEKALDAPASVATINAAEIARAPAPTPSHHLVGLPGVDIVQTGLTQTSVVSRGFNSAFSGALLTLIDNRYARVPSLRLNAGFLVPTSDLDIERIEVALGPGAALYGPNAASGVMHIITKSPIDNPGGSIMIGGGERNVVHGQARSSFRFADWFGMRFSGQYFRGQEWESAEDPVERDARRAALQEDPNTLVGLRSPNNARYTFDSRADFRTGGAEIILSGGVSEALETLQTTNLGTAQAVGWKVYYAQARISAGRLFGQAFVNQTSTGTPGQDRTYLLRSGEPLSDDSKLIAAQLQHGLDLGSRQSFIYGLDWQYTDPRTMGTINGSFEDEDQILETGVYLHSETRLSDKLDFVAAIRYDHHSALPKNNISPRAAVVYSPSEGHTARFTYNRAFSAPASTNLFLDINAGIVPITSAIYYDLRASGVPSTGFTWSRTCEGGYMNLCMYSPFALGEDGAPVRMPASASAIWTDFVRALVPAQLQALLVRPGLLPGDPELKTVLRLLDSEAAGRPDAGIFEIYPEAPNGPVDIPPLVARTNDNLEIGYNGLFADRMMFTGSVYATRIENFIGGLVAESPQVFVEPASLEAFARARLAPLIQAGLMTEEELATLVGAGAGAPLGTVAPDQYSDHSILVAPRNYGETTVWGAEMGAQLLATDRVTLGSSYTYHSDECANAGTDACVALNAPKHKGTLSLSFDDPGRGFSFGAMGRATAGFYMQSGVYAGRVESYATVDLSMGYRLPFDRNAHLSFSVSNALNNLHTEFVGGGMIGRLALARIRYDLDF